MWIGYVFSCYNIKQMNIFRTRFGITTIAIISGHPRFDRTANNIMDAISAQSKSSVEFVGVIGDQYSNKMSNRYASTSMLDHEEVEITRNYREQLQDSGLNPYRAITHYKNHQLLSKLQADKFYDDIYIKKAKAVIAVGNFSLMRRMFINITNEFNEKGALKPLRLSFDLMNAYRTVDSEEYLDFMYNNLPRIPESQVKYIFPSMCVGYEGLFKAFQFLQKYKTDDSSFLSKNFSYEVSQLVAKARQQFRTAKGINQDHYITLIAPGNTEGEIKFSLNKFSESLNKFSQRSEISGVDKQFFKVFVLLPEDENIASKIRSAAGSLGSQVVFIESKDKYAAMCASDFALLHNGEVTVEAAACQLPATVVSSMSNWKAYLSYLYNGHCSPLNVSTNYEGYIDLMGSSAAHSEKIATLMVDHFQRPKLRFHYAKLYREQIQKMLMMSGHNPSLSVEKTGLERAAEDILHKISLNQKIPAKASKFERQQKLHVF